DSAGNPVTIGGRTFGYNAAGRMVAATNGSVVTTFVYNALGQRIKKSTGGVATFYSYDESGHLIGEYDASGTPLQEIVWLEDIPVASVRLEPCGLSVFYIHTDHLNTPRRITRRSTAQAVWQWESDPFGSSPPNENPSGLGTFNFNLRFPGQYFDSETSLSYNYFRDYDSVVGRYLESDPTGLQGGLNTYGYALQNPVASTDPLGLDTYQCTRKLNKVPFRFGPLFHQFVCVGDKATGYTCGGLTPSASRVFDTPGVIHNDEYQASRCELVRPEDDCVEKCLKAGFKAPPPNYSLDLSQGENCQSYATGAVSDCVATCTHPVHKTPKLPWEPAPTLRPHR
ncbi:MAG: RHS repeat-associated core domain-containing protein, partial [Gammaproteobacteria bacterium]